MKFPCLLLLACVGIQGCVNAQTEQNPNSSHRSKLATQVTMVEFKKLAPDATPQGLPEINRNGGFEGQLTFAFDALAQGFEQKGTPTYLAVETIQSADGTPNKPQFYTVEKSPSQRQDVKFGVIFDPQFSPNGEYILFKFGNADTYGTYKLYVLNVKTNAIKMISKRMLSCRKTLWSPDSKYVAYVDGGDSQGFVEHGDFLLAPLQLYVCHWQNAEEHLVVENNSLIDSFSWMAPHVLLYGVLPDDAQASNEAKNSSEKSSCPNIYEYSVDERKSRLLIKDGYRPTASSDGQWVAFFGSEKPRVPYPLRSSWMKKPGDAVLTIAQNDGSKRKSLNLEAGLYPYVIWKPDNRHLLTIQDVENGGVNGRAQVTEWDIQTGKFRVIATLEEAKFGRAISDFKPLSFSPDGSTLFFLSFERVGQRIEGMRGVFVAERNSLHALDLATGKVTPVVQFKSNWGMDWLPATK